MPPAGGTGRSLLRVLTLTHDVTSPASALAVARFERLAADGLPVTFRGIDVLGLDATVPVTLDLLAELEGVREAAATLGVQLRTPSRRPPTALVHLVADLAEEIGRGSAWRAASYGAYWQHDADLGDRAVVADLAAAAGLPEGRVAELLADRAALAAIRRRSHTARGEGIGGVPVLVAHGTLVDPGVDDDALRALARGG